MPNTPDNTPTNRNISKQDWTLFATVSFMRPLSIAVVIAAIFFGVNMIAFNLLRHDAQPQKECPTLPPLVVPVRGTLP